MATTSKPARSSSKTLGRYGLSLARHLPRHGTFYVAFAIGVVVGIGAWFVRSDFALPVGAIATFAVYLTLAAIVVPELTPQYLRHRAASTDTPTVLIFAVVAVSVLISIVTLFLALNRRGADASAEIILSILSVLLAWFTVHSMAAFHYAFEYYEESADSDESGPKTAAGLDFHSDGDEAPSGLDFFYFSFAIATSSAVSDVDVKTRRMRRIVMLHSIMAFFFNTLIFAATVNVAVAVGQG